MTTQKSKWELVANAGDGAYAEWTHKLKIPGGWLYREELFSTDSDGAFSVAICFVPEKEEKP